MLIPSLFVNTIKQLKYLKERNLLKLHLPYMQVHVISCGAFILLRNRGSFYKRQPIYFATHIFNTYIVRLKISIAEMQRVGSVIVIQVYISNASCDHSDDISPRSVTSFFWRHLLLLNMDSAFDSIYLKQYLYLASQISGAGEGRTLTFPKHFATET